MFKDIRIAFVDVFGNMHKRHVEGKICSLSNYFLIKLSSEAQALRVKAYVIIFLVFISTIEKWWK